MKEYSRKELCTSYSFLIPLLLFILVLSTSLHAGGNRRKDEWGDIQFWHSMGTYNKEVLSGLVSSYNEKQKGYMVKAIFQGNPKEIANGLDWIPIPYLDYLMKGHLATSFRCSRYPSRCSASTSAMSFTCIESPIPLDRMASSNMIRQYGQAVTT